MALAATPSPTIVVPSSQSAWDDDPIDADDSVESRSDMTIANAPAAETTTPQSFACPPTLQNRNRSRRHSTASTNTSDGIVLSATLWNVVVM